MGLDDEPPQQQGTQQVGAVAPEALSQGADVQGKAGEGLYPEPADMNPPVPENIVSEPTSTPSGQ